jgi:hypothetical protein
MLTDAQQSSANIANMRDPIYKSTYDSVEKAIDSKKPIAGTLFWKWAIPVFQKQSPRGDYGVLTTDSTFKYIKDHAVYMKKKLNSVPPKPSCGLESWVGVVDPVTLKRTCNKVPGLAQAYYSLPASNASSLGVSEEALTYAQQVKAGAQLVFPNKVYCCKPGVGAFENGCTQEA